ncbi:hypothetical protein EVAR_60005_1 [Eumeta japonica]|uniref:Uncharacterized protein n=1 Tax=Eumeta variegata TaxID=151549 RepID=A0A4C1ZA42_EUMVA|nr:hypothetical protein EVAR_60005_1 [Eumeta japonica]
MSNRESVEVGNRILVLFPISVPDSDPIVNPDEDTGSRQYCGRLILWATYLQHENRTLTEYRRKVTASAFPLFLRQSFLHVHTQEADNELVTALGLRVSMGDDEHLFSGRSLARVASENSIK